MCEMELQNIHSLSNTLLIPSGTYVDWDTSINEKNYKFYHCSSVITKSKLLRQRGVPMQGITHSPVSFPPKQ